MLAFNHLPIAICFAGFDLLPFAVGIEELKAVLSEREKNGAVGEDRVDQGDYAAFNHVLQAQRASKGEEGILSLKCNRAFPSPPQESPYESDLQATPLR